MVFSMKLQRIRLREGDTIGDVLKVFKDCDAQKIIFECPRGLSFITDSSFLKRLKKTAIENEKKLELIVSQKFIRQIIQAQKIEVFSKWEDTEIDIESENIITLSKFKGQVDATPNKTKAEKVKEAEKEAPKVLSTETSEPLFSKHRIENTAFDQSLRSHIFFGFLLVLLLLGGLFWWISPSVTIIVKPKISIIPFTQNIIVQVAGGEVPSGEKQLPIIKAIFVETEQEGEQTFPSGDLRYDVTNAKGKVTLFNKTAAPKYLVPSRLQSPDGSIFRFKEPIEIPPQDGSIPGQLVVEIEADGFIDEDLAKPIGSKGNIEAGTLLTFPALSESLQDLYYAKANKGPLVGGSTLTRYFVQQEDFERAQELFLNIMRTQGVDQLTEEIETRSKREGRDYVFVDDRRVLTAEITEMNIPESLIGKESQTFSVKGKVRIFGVVFDQAEVLKSLEKRIKETQDQRKKLMRLDSTSIDYQILEAENLEKEGWVKLSVSVAGIESLDIEDDNAEALNWRKNLISQMKQKSIREARAILLNDSEIENVQDIKITPFWIKTLPALEDQIKFESIGTD